MTFRVTMTATAIKERKRLDPTSRKRIDAALRKLLKDPRPPGVKKLAGSQHDWRLRVGNHRILYGVDDEGQVVTMGIRGVSCGEWRVAGGVSGGHTRTSPPATHVNPVKS